MWRVPLWGAMAPVRVCVCVLTLSEICVRVGIGDSMIKSRAMEMERRERTRNQGRRPVLIVEQREQERAATSARAEPPRPGSERGTCGHADVCGMSLAG